MRRPGLTVDEVAALVSRQIEELRRLGVSLDKAVRVVAEDHHISFPAATQLLLRQRRREQRTDHENQAAA